MLVLSPDIGLFLRAPQDFNMQSDLRTTGKLYFELGLEDAWGYSHFR